MEWVFGVVIVLVILGAFAQQQNHDAAREAVPDYSATQAHDPKAWEKNKTGISIDENRKKICLIDHGNPQPYRLIAYDDILESEIIENGYGITKTSRGSQLIGGAVGAAVLGGAGLVVGALSGKKVSKEKASSVELKIVVKDTSRPIHSINFLANETDKGSMTYKAAMDKAQHWHAILSIIVANA